MRRTGAALALAAIAVTGCSSARSNDAAAEIDGATVSRSRYEALVRDVAANPERFGIEEDFATGTIAGDPGRSLLTDLVQSAAMERYLVTNGGAITDADRQTVVETIGPQAEGVPPGVLDLYVGLQAAGAALGRMAGQSGEAQAAWDSSPADVGLLCVRHILVESEDEALDVLAELDGGADFAELAAERSIEPAAATTGGAIEVSPEQPCIGLAEAAGGGLDPVFLAAAVEAVPGTPIGPVQTSFGWHVILARPYDEVAVAVDPAVGGSGFEEYLGTVDVEVDPRYGRWDPDVGSVVALEAPPPTTVAL
ncbi:MAG: peptidylprolyl isomerase [Ilumatobacteraceae bacterium]